MDREGLVCRKERKGRLLQNIDGTCVRGCTDVESTCRSPQVKLKAYKKKVQERDIKVQKKADIKGRCVVRAFCGK